MNEAQMAAEVTRRAERLAVPGAAVGIVDGGTEHYAFHGVTSLENPLPVDAHTLFQFGSTGKTFTATAIMRLVEQGKVSLDASVRTYVPELRLKDEDVAKNVNVLHLLNHTAGWSGDMMDDTGDGDDALAKFVERMATADQVTPLGATVSYNNASLSLAGRVIEKVTGTTYEQAMKDLVLAPLGLSSTYFFMNEIMTRRFATGHNRKQDGTIQVARPWALPRGGAPAGGMSANAADQIAWARFHMGDGRAADGTRILSEQSVRRMQRQTAACPGMAIGDACGITWWLTDVGGVRTVAHGGTTNGQHSAFLMVPERGFAFVSLTNCGPNGPELNEELLKWALNAYLGVEKREPEPVAMSAETLAAFTGMYDTVAATCEIAASGGGLSLTVAIKPEAMASLMEAGAEPPEDDPPIAIMFLSGPGDRYVVSDGPAKGMTGYFARDAEGRVTGVHVGGRLAVRLP